MEIVRDIACPNERCQYFGQQGGDNVYVRRRYGKDQIRFCNCRTCGAQFSERRGTALFGVRLPRAKVVDVVKHLAEGNGVRATHRLTGVCRDTVGRIVLAVGEHAKEIHDKLVRGIDVIELQMDEMWSFVGKKRQASQARGGRGRPARKRVGSHGH